MPMTASKLVLHGWAVAAIIIGICATLVLVPGAAPDWGLPLFFWSLMGLLFIVATAAAVGLPLEKAGPWRTLLLALFACRMYYNPLSYEHLFHRLLRLVPDPWRKPLMITNSDNLWDRSVIQMLIYLAIAGAAALVALLATRRGKPLTPGQGHLRFRIIHLFGFSAFVALTCMALRYASPPVNEATSLTLLALRVGAAIYIGAGRGNALFCWGFLFGSFGWEYFIDHTQFTAEWGAWLPQSLSRQRPDWPVEFQYFLLMALLPLYGGILTGVLAALFYQRAELPSVNDKGHAEA